MTRITLKRITIISLVVLLVSGVIFLASGDNRSERSVVLSEQSQATFTVQQGPLLINVVESGTIKARDQAIIKSEVEGKNVLLWIIEEGKEVKKGDLLVELDASNLQDKLVDQQIMVNNKESDFIRSRENLDVVKNQAQSDIEKAELDLGFARQDLQKYVEGEYPKEVKETESKITVAREEVRRAEEKLDWSKVLFKEKYISQTELQADELAAKKAQLDLELASEELALLKRFTHSRKIAELESDARQAEMALERMRRKAAADVVQAKAELQANKSQYDREVDKMEKIEDQILKTKIYAPADGLVIYATTARASWRGNAEPLAAGQEVNEREELIYLPRTASVLAEVKLHESSLNKVRIGMPVQITVDALPNKSYRGTMQFISPLPDAASMWLNPDLKLYKSEVYIEGDSQGLRTGMSCRADILVQQLEAVVYVPVQAVMRVGGQPTVFIAGNGALEERAVETGLDNGRMIHIKNGLQPGELVSLVPPLDRGQVDPKPSQQIIAETRDQ